MFVETCDPNVYSIATVLNFTSMWPSQTNVNRTMHMWLNNENCHTRPIYFIILLQLIAIVLHYLCIVHFQAYIVGWSTFLKQIFPIQWIHSWDNELHRQHQIGYRSLKLTSTVMRCLLGYIGFSWPMVNVIATPHSAFVGVLPPPTPPHHLPTSHPIHLLSMLIWNECMSEETNFKILKVQPAAS